jgi:2-polyprenyl-3-methyl-5-hydroxy-6-metoxy-1,4-benzoquinol methylase
MSKKTDQVRALFESPNQYLDRRTFDIAIRAEVVEYFTRGRRFEHALDIGCGNGAISLPLLPRCRRLTLLDLSQSMLSLAHSRVPSERAVDVTMIRGDFCAADLPPHSFDLICCIGVLAHVTSPGEVISKIRQLATPDALIILEFTDSFHFWGIPIVLYQTLLRLMRPQPYPLNRLRKAEVLELCNQNGLILNESYRYGLPPLGSSLFLNQAQMGGITRRLFGPANGNRNRWMGNQFICSLTPAFQDGTLEIRDSVMEDRNAELQSEAV